MTTDSDYIIIDQETPAELAAEPTPGPAFSPAPSLLARHRRLVLTLGMAVDANILVNERIREEFRLGRPPLAALEAGFTRAYATIFDSNATAFLAHVMLFAFGSGPVRGFAITITVGIITTLFTAWMLTRLFVSRWYIATRPQTLPV